MIGLSLAVLSVACGLAALWIFRLTTDLTALWSTVRRIHAHLLEFRLFYDEPRLIWHAQKAVIRENLRLILLMARPLLILTLPMAWLLVQLESMYAYAPLTVGQPSVLTVQVSSQLAPDAAASLEMPPGISVETAPVRSLAESQISWRIRPVRAVHGNMRLDFRGVSIEKNIAAGTRPIFLMRKRARSLVDFVLHPEEARLPAGEIAWVEVAYPRTAVVIAGVALPWMVWFVLISFASMVFARWFRIFR